MANKRYINGIKPCPFCGKDAKTYKFASTNIWTVICKCGCECPKDSISEKGAIRIWNRRRFKNIENEQK